MALDNDGSGDKDGRTAAASICAKFPATAKARWRRWARICAPRACAGAMRSPQCQPRPEDPQGPSGSAGRRPAGRPAGQDLRDRLCALLCPASGPGRRRSMSSASSRKFPAAPTNSRREPAPIHQDEGRRLPHGWRIIAGVVVLLLGYGAWHLLSPGGDASQPVPPPPVLNPPKPVPQPAPQPVVAPRPDRDAVAGAEPAPRHHADRAGQQAAATPPPAAGAKTPATQPTPMSAASPAAAADRRAAPAALPRRAARRRSMARRIAIPAWFCAPAATPASRCAAPTARSAQPRSQGRRQSIRCPTRRA